VCTKPRGECLWWESVGLVRRFLFWWLWLDRLHFDRHMSRGCVVNMRLTSCAPTYEATILLLLPNWPPNVVRRRAVTAAIFPRRFGFHFNKDMIAMEITARSGRAINNIGVTRLPLKRFYLKTRALLLALVLFHASISYLSSAQRRISRRIVELLRRVR
jgi:hypothetical protein